MEFYAKLPRNKRESALFMLVISVISVNIIAPLITCFECGFSLSAWGNALQILPFVWLSVVALVLLLYKPASSLTKRIVAKDDSFKAQILGNILCSVFLMSICLTVIGTWIGGRTISLTPLREFFYKWPRNFAISFAVELLVAQPIARRVMEKLHERIDCRATAGLES